MLEDIRLYIMQRLVEMKTKAMNLEDRITPSIIKRLEILKEQQSHSNLFLGARGIPCVHHVAAYLFLNKKPGKGVDHEVVVEVLEEAKVRKVVAWVIRGRAIGRGGRSGRARGRGGRGQGRGGKGRGRGVSTMLVDEKKCMCKLWELLGIPCVHHVAAYLFLKKKPGKGVDHGRPRKNKVKAKSENNSQESGSMGDVSGGRGHASGGLGEASGALGEASDGLEGEVVEVKAEVVRVEGRGVSTMLVDEKEMNEEEIRKNMKHEYMEQILIKEEEKRITAEKAIQEEFDEEVVRLTLEKEARYEKNYQDKIREDEESKYNQMWYNHGITPSKSTSTMEECGEYVKTQESIGDRGEPCWRLTKDAPIAEQSVSAQPSIAATETTPKGNTIKVDAAK
nr:hypothetical protein [Tanacetum cinerariifolium]